MYDLDKRAGNTGLTGSYFWRIDNSDGRKALDRCLTWAFFQWEINFLYWHTLYVRWDWRMACPCSGWQAWFDRRFFWAWRKYSWPNWCFESRRSKYIWYNTGGRFVYFRMRQLCCYSTDWQDWGSLKIGSPDGSRVKCSFIMTIGGGGIVIKVFTTTSRPINIAALIYHFAIFSTIIARLMTVGGIYLHEDVSIFYIRSLFPSLSTITYWLTKYFNRPTDWAAYKGRLLPKSVPFITGFS